MKQAPPCPGPSSWARGTFAAAIAVLIVLQAGLLLLFGRRTPEYPEPLPPPAHILALAGSWTSDDLLQKFFVSDPTVFIFPNSHDFSGRGWLNDKPIAFQSIEQLEDPAWLALNPARLATNMMGLPYGIVPVAALPEPPSHREEPTPLFLAPEQLAMQSSLAVLGDLANRFAGGAPTLKSWPSPTRILSSSTVQIAVDSTGGVIASRLENGCGLAEADGAAVAAARAMRFSPAPNSPTEWGQIVFRWQTAAP